MIDFSHEEKKDIFEWDVVNWSSALDFWAPCLGDLSGKRGLAVGDRRGGLSLGFALLGARVTCTDPSLESATARALHDRYEVAERIEYERVDATGIPGEEGTYDFVSFKSVLGALGEREQQLTAIRELHRVLKQNGWLLFAENLEASGLHRWLRDRFVEWSDQWRYLKYEERNRLFEVFDERSFRTHGFLGTLGRSPGKKAILGRLDSILGRFLPARWQYILLGRCRK